MEDWLLNRNRDCVLRLYPECVFIKNGGFSECHFGENMIIFLHSCTKSGVGVFLFVCLFWFFFFSMAYFYYQSSNIRTY